MVKTYTNFKSLTNDMSKSIQKSMNNLNAITKYDILYGIPAGKKVDGENIADYAKVVNFGSLSKQIPARPWLSSLRFRFSQKIYKDIDTAILKIKNKSTSKIKIRKNLRNESPCRLSPCLINLLKYLEV